MKKFLLVICTITLFSTSKAQDKTEKFPNFQLGIAIAPLANSMSSYGYKTGIAINVSANLKKLNEDIMLFGETGLVFFPGNGYDGNYKRTNGTLIPIILGANYITNNLKIGVGIGYSSFNSGDETEAGTVSGLTFSPRISYAIGKFDAQFKYVSVSVNSKYAWVDPSHYQYGIVYKF
jgi:hypothetical protein